MKVIFLDFDGVMNNCGSHNYHKRRIKRYMKEFDCDYKTAERHLGRFLDSFDPVCASNFQIILDEHPDAMIVLSTSWRNIHDTEFCKKKLEEYFVDSSRVIGKTPVVIRGWTSGDRTDEIAQYLDEHPEVENYIILDDAFISGVYHYRHVQTDWDGGGLTQKHVRDALAYLSHPGAPREPKPVTEDKDEDDREDS